MSTLSAWCWIAGFVLLVIGMITAASDDDDYQSVRQNLLDYQNQELEVTGVTSHHWPKEAQLRNGVIVNSGAFRDEAAIDLVRVGDRV